MDNSIENRSNSVISHSSELSYSNPTRTPITAKDIITSYGAIYKTTGGSDNKLGGLYLKSFLNKLVSNRVLDLYLKYLGIKMLTTATLVPISLIMGRDLFEKSINYIVSSDQKGGNFLENKIPLLDDDLLGNYLKISGLTALTLSSHTLIPLGVLMSIYSLYINEQKGGTKLITGASIPPNIFQNINDVVSGSDITHTPLRQLPYYNNEMQLNTFTDNYNGSIDNLESTANIAGFPEYNIPDSKVNLTISPNESNNLSSNNSSNSIASSNISGNEIHPESSNIDLDIVKSMAGGGSDWLSTHNSRGNINSPTMSENQFRMFNKTADYISNNDLSGISDKISNSSSYSHSTLYEMTPHDTVPNGYNIGGVSMNKFS